VILSADSRQFYKEMSIGTAKPSFVEQNGIKHYFIDSHSISEEVTAAKFAEEANEVLKSLFQIHETIILTGGSGMFVDALCIGLDNIPSSRELRDQLSEEVEKEGLSLLLEELKVKDPVFFNQVDKQNPVRVIRAIEAIRLTGLPFSELRKASPQKNNFEVLRFIIEHPREQLYNRINLRVDNMMQMGLLEEVKTLLPFKHLNALKTVGYRELFDFIDGKTNLETAIELIKQNSRRYAKRQLTWLKRHEDATILTFDKTASMLNHILSKLNALENSEKNTLE
jgi:tRNA dimethylallyltransferase